MENSTSKIIVLCGPTAVGKTDLSLLIAETFSCEIVGVDSMQVYRHMDIGTAKPTQAERARINHYLIDIVDPDDNYTLGRFVKDAQEAIRKINSHNNIPLLVGGTGLYLKGLLQGLFAEDYLAAEAVDNEGKSCTESVRDDLRKRLLETGNETLYRELAEVDPDSAERIHPNDTQRLLRGLEIFYTTGKPWSRHLTDQKKNTTQYQTLKIGLTRPRQELYERIDKRVCLMAEQGLLDEVKMLLDMGYAKELKAMQSIGYRHMINFLDNKWTWEQTLEMLARDTRHYAKRQFTWFNNDKEISWYDVRQQDTILKEIKRFLLLQDSFS
ncbi:MAG: tRNA (adenosine(37)-N6)-dimethylallyltransferase MiaA [Deltaproteobacteria bacterium]|nr:tRNA (adenosine(37)-N6)-dimethylallyltransferase MiaA [Deltaproteobacteria bacterium]